MNDEEQERLRKFLEGNEPHPNRLEQYLEQADADIEAYIRLTKNMPAMDADNLVTIVRRLEAMEKLLSHLEVILVKVQTMLKRTP